MKARVKPVVAALAATGVVTLGAWGGSQIENIIPPAQAAQQASAPAVQAVPDFASIAERYGPAVVNVSVVHQKAGLAQQIPDELLQGPFGEYFRHFQPPQGQVPQQRGMGSGFIISADGLILTNAHVVADASEVVVKLTDRREFKAKVVGSDPQTDVAVLRIEATDLPAVKLGNPDSVRPGDWVLAIGSPFGFENTVTSGIVSAKARSLPDGTYVPFIQTDVAINPGNSGGPLFNMQGEVIGINSQIYSRTGGYQGLAFAIPIDVAVNVQEQLVATGHVERGRLGVTIQEVSQPLAKSFGLERPRGALVSKVEEGSAADQAGIESGDVIVSYDGKPIERSSELPGLVASTKPGTKAAVDVWREGGKTTLEVTVGELQSQSVASAGQAEAENARLGVAVRPLTPQERSSAGLEGGLVVQNATGAAARAGIRQGDVIVGVNGAPVKSVDDLRERLDKAEGHVALLVKRGEASMFVPVPLG